MKTKSKILIEEMSNFIQVKDETMHYLEHGSGDPILYIHGNPTSSYLWRNIIPNMEGRNIAIDLIGMGKSAKPNIKYSFLDHYSYLEEFINKLEIDNITLVIHDWGAALGFQYALNHPRNIKSIIFMEPVIFPVRSLDDLKGDVGEFFKNVKDPKIGYEMIIKQNFFIENMLPAMVRRKLSGETLDFYRNPYIKEEDRIPLLKWPLEVPIGGEPVETHGILENIVSSLKNGNLADIPKLLLYVNPGAMMTNELVEYCMNNFPNLTTSYIGEGLHFIQEDLPNEITNEIQQWLNQDEESLK